MNHIDVCYASRLNKEERKKSFKQIVKQKCEVWIKIKEINKLRSCTKSCKQDKKKNLMIANSFKISQV